MLVFGKINLDMERFGQSPVTIEIESTYELIKFRVGLGFMQQNN